MVSEIEVMRFLSSGYGNGYGDGNGYGYGNGYGNGNGNGYGDGYGNGNGLLEISGYKVYQVDNVPTLFDSIRGNFAKGYTIKNNTILVPCFIAKINGFFAHGETLHSAVDAATEKYKESRPLDERIGEFVETHTELDKPYDDLFSWHHILTGSCEFGRKQWCENHGLKPTDSITVRQFLDWTANDYGGEIIKQVKARFDLW